MKRMNRGDRDAVLHFLTLNIREKRRPFINDCYARTVLEQLRHHCDAHPARLVAYVAMPDHLHAIVSPRDGRINHFLSQFKAGATMAVKTLAVQMGQQAVTDWLQQTPDGHAQLWQDGKHDFHLYSERLIWQKINYIHNNPIRQGLVRHANEYPYSSFTAMYHLEGRVIIPIDAEWWWTECASGS